MSHHDQGYKQSRHICPRNCYSACSILAYSKNGVLKKLEGDPEHGYTQGTLCTKGYSYLDTIYHRDRLKYPMKQMERGSGKFERITWEEAIDTISSKIIDLHSQYGSNQSLCLNKFSGNLGLLHYSVEKFFSSLGGITRIVGNPCWSAGYDAGIYSFGSGVTSDLSEMVHSKLIILWGTNPAWTSVHSLAHIFKAQENGAIVVVIDPVYTATAEKADYYIQVKPSGDGALALAIAKILIESNLCDEEFIQKFTYGYEPFKRYCLSLQSDELSKDSGVDMHIIKDFAKLIGKNKPSFIWIGFGLQRHSNGGQNIRAIHSLSALTGSIGVKGGGVNYAQDETWKFTSLIEDKTGSNDRKIDIHQFSENFESIANPPIKFLWVSCKNILSQDPQINRSIHTLSSIEFIVTVEHFLTTTALASDIVLPATSFFEEEDVVAGYWHHFIGYNEKAIHPYFESKSDLDIVKLLSKSLNQKVPNFSRFPDDWEMTQFIDHEFNPNMYKLLGISHWRELKLGIKRARLPKTAWEEKVFNTPSQKFEFYSMTAKENSQSSIARYKKGKSPSIDYPYWLLSTHAQHGINSQFVNSTNIRPLSKKPIFIVHPKTVRKHQLSQSGLAIIFNQLGEIEGLVEESDIVAEDIILVEQGWSLNHKSNINTIVPGDPTDLGELSTGAKGIAFYDTFVNLKSVD